MTDRSNLIFVSLDSVRRDAVLQGNLPAMQRMIREGVLFSSATSSSPLTPVSHATVLSGLQPYHHGIRHLFREQLAPGVITLPQILQTEGYATAAFVASAGLNAWYGIDRGFTYYDDEVPSLPDGRHPLEAVDVAVRGQAYTKGAEVMRKAVKWLSENRERRFFVFVHLFDAHWPYAPPEPYSKKYSGNLYAGEVAYMDACLGHLFARLEDWKLLDTTLIVCFSDHGEDLGQYGGVGSKHPYEAGHGCLLYDVTQQVFCILHHPGLLPSPRHIKQQVRLVDVMPTVLELLDLQQVDRTDGISLVPLSRGEKLSIPLIGYSETHFADEYAAEGSETPCPEITEAVRVETGDFWRTCAATADPPRKLKAVRIETAAGIYKVIWEMDGDGVWVYDLESDPFERNDLLK